MSPDPGAVMLVEDDPGDVRLIQRAFAKAGLTAELIRLSNGDEAVAYLDGRSPYENRTTHPLPALLILDIKLPRRTGLEVLKWLRDRNDGLRRLPTIMLTASTHAADVDRAYDYGANSYLAKPETSEALLDIAHSIKKYWLTLNENPTLSGGKEHAR